MAEWSNGPLLAFDCETTDKDPEEARIVSAATVLIDAGKIAFSHSWLSDLDGEEIPAEATAVHGITTERAHVEGEPAREVLWQILETIVKRPLGAPMIAFVARFDLTVVDREMRRMGLGGLDDIGLLHVLDPLVIDRHLDKFRKGSRTLEAVARYYERKDGKKILDAAHDATSDALAAARLAWVLGKCGQIVRRTVNDQGEKVQKWADEKMALEHHWEQVRDDLPALHEAQKVWARDQADGLREHFRAKGDPAAAEVRSDWPILRLPVVAHE